MKIIISSTSYIFSSIPFFLTNSHYLLTVTLFFIWIWIFQVVTQFKVTHYIFCKIFVCMLLFLMHIDAYWYMFSSILIKLS